MARWRLAAPHYLNLTGDDKATWEYKEIDRTSGKPKMVRFDVPSLLDPDQPGDWNYRHGNDQGEIIVADKRDSQHPRDYVFIGEPTPDMVPLDDEAKAISDRFALKWKHPIESLSGTYSEHLLNQLQDEVAEVRSKSTSSTQVEGMSELLTAMTQMMKQNQDMLQLIATNVAAPAPTPARKV